MTKVSSSKSIAGDIAVNNSDTAVRKQRVSLDTIVIAPDRLRRLNPAWAEVIGMSMVEAGQLQDIGLIEMADGRLELSFGLHRVHGAIAIGHTEINASIRADDGSARRDELFENLIRAPLSALDRAIYLSELKSVHERLHPHTRNGAQGGRGAQRNESEIFAFSKVAAEQTGLSRRAIELAVSITSRLKGDVITRLRGTPLETNQGALLQLAAQSSNLHGPILDILLAPVAERKTDILAEAIALAQGLKLASPSDKLFRSVNDKVARLKPEARAVLFSTYEAEILAFAKQKGWL